MFKLLNRTFNFKIPEINIRIPAYSLLGVPLLAYLIWEIYWYNKVGLCVIKWHTHLALYVYLWVIGFVLYKFITRKVTSEKKQNAFLLFTSISICLILAEGALQLLCIRKTYMERVTGAYYSPYASQETTHYHVWWNGEKEHWIKKPEFTYWRPTNSQGLPDVEWPKKRPAGQKRILALGDSFTEGDGAPDDSDYVARLSHKLHTIDTNYYLMNAGVLGSDPFFNYIQLKDSLLQYKPDYIIQALSVQDIIGDIRLRGGMERFKKDGTVKFNKAPWWEPVYALSYISRLGFSLLGYSELLNRQIPSAAETDKLNKETVDLFKQYTDLCAKNNIRLFVVLRPDITEIEMNRYFYNLSPILNNLHAEVIDLLPYYQQYIKAHNTSRQDYFWKLDGHHNSKGYEMMASGIFESLAPLLAHPATAKAAQ